MPTKRLPHAHTMLLTYVYAATMYTVQTHSQSNLERCGMCDFFDFYLSQNYVKFNVQIFYDIRLVVEDLKNSKQACRHRDVACK